MMAERDTNDRYLAAYLSDRVGTEFDGGVAGIARFGLFVKLDETACRRAGADLVARQRVFPPRSRRPDPDGREVAPRDRVGQRVTVRLQEAVPVTGGLLFELLAVEGRNMPTSRRTGSGGAPRRKLSQRRIKRSKERKRDERGR